MKNLKKIIVVGAVVLAVSAASFSALAVSGYGSPAEIVAGLTGQSVESITAEKTESGVTFGTIAAQYGVLDEFRAQLLELRKGSLAERVARGTMTQERADARIAAMESAECDGTGSGAAGGACNGTCDDTCDGTGSGAGTSFGGMRGIGGGQGNRGSGQGGNGTGTCTA